MPARSAGSRYRVGSAALAAAALLLCGGRHLPTWTPQVAIAEESIDSAAATQRPGVEPAGKQKTARPLAGRDKAKAKDSPAEAVDPTLALAAQLRQLPDEQAVAAVKKLGELGTPAAIELLLGELASGLPPRVAKSALELLTNRKGSDGPSPASTLALYAHHRNPELRKQALAGLAALPVVVSPAAVPVVSLLIAALSDPSAEVRSVAAGALGARHEKSAEPALIQLLLRKDPAAPPALGQIGGPDTARALAEMIGNVPDGMILQTLGELLRRPDFGPEPVRVQVVKTVGKMPGSQTLDILGDYVTDTAKDKLRPSRVEAQKIIEQRTAK